MDRVENHPVIGNRALTVAHGRVGLGALIPGIRPFRVGFDRRVEIGDGAFEVAFAHVGIGTADKMQGARRKPDRVVMVSQFLFGVAFLTIGVRADVVAVAILRLEPDRLTVIADRFVALPSRVMPGAAIEIGVRTIGGTFVRVLDHAATGGGALVAKAFVAVFEILPARGKRAAADRSDCRQHTEES